MKRNIANPLDALNQIPVPSFHDHGGLKIRQATFSTSEHEVLRSFDIDFQQVWHRSTVRNQLSIVVVRHVIVSRI